MPLFDYRCPSCDRRFEALVRGSTQVACPDCAETAVVRLQPMPARPAGRGGDDALPDLKQFGPPSGGCCGGGGCGH